jgi:hypothetical protein
MHIEDEIKLIESNITTSGDKIHKNIEGFCIDDKKNLVYFYHPIKWSKTGSKNRINIFDNIRYSMRREKNGDFILISYKQMLKYKKFNRNMKDIHNTNFFIFHILYSILYRTNSIIDWLKWKHFKIKNEYRYYN